MIGKELPSWTSEQESFRDGRVYFVGYSEMSADKSDHHIAKAALMDAEVKLISEAPTEIRVITQNALKGAGVDSSEFVQIQTSLREVIGLSGAKPHESTCRKFVRYGESRNNITRACWHRASISQESLRKAYLMTMKAKYGDEKAHKFDDLMKDELKKINDNRRFDREERKPASNVNLHNTNDSVSNPS